MANMSYCRFENTYLDMRDCVDFLHEMKSIDDLDLSKSEMEYCDRLYHLCYNYIEAMESMRGKM